MFYEINSDVFVFRVICKSACGVNSYKNETDGKARKEIFIKEIQNSFVKWI